MNVPRRPAVHHFCVLRPSSNKNGLKALRNGHDSVKITPRNVLGIKFFKYNSLKLTREIKGETISIISKL